MDDGSLAETISNVPWLVPSLVFHPSHTDDHASSPICSIGSSRAILMHLIHGDIRCMDSMYIHLLMEYNFGSPRLVSSRIHLPTLRRLRLSVAKSMDGRGWGEGGKGNLWSSPPPFFRFYIFIQFSPLYMFMNHEFLNEKNR